MLQDMISVVYRRITISYSHNQNEGEAIDMTIGEKQEERKFNTETQTSKTVDIMNELQKLVSLKDSGALTEEEFTKLKQDLLNNK